MTGVNPDRHPARDIYGHMPLSTKSVGMFKFVQAAVAKASGNSPAFHARPLRTAGVSLLTTSQMEHALTMSSGLFGEDAATILSKLQGGLTRPDIEEEDGISVEVIDVGTLPTDRNHVVAFVEHPSIHTAESEILLSLYDLGGVALCGSKEGAHISFGSFTRGVPKGVGSALEDNVPNTFVVGLPMVEMLSRSGQRAA